MAWKVDSASSVRELLSLVWQVFLGFFYWRKSPPPTQLIHDKPVQSFTYTHSPKSILKWTFSQIWESEKNRKHCHLVFSRFLQNVMCSREGFPGDLDSKESACKAEDPGSTSGSGRSPEKGMATHTSILAWRIPWTEEPGGLQSTESQRVGHNWATNTSTFLTEPQSYSHLFNGAQSSLIYKVTSYIVE